MLGKLTDRFYQLHNFAWLQTETPYAVYQIVHVQKFHSFYTFNSFGFKVIQDDLFSMLGN